VPENMTRCAKTQSGQGPPDGHDELRRGPSTLKKGANHFRTCCAISAHDEDIREADRALLGPVAATGGMKKGRKLVSSVVPSG